MMKNAIVCLFCLCFSVPMVSVQAAATDPQPFLGRWALYLPGGAGWLEVRQEEGYLDGDILWYGGSVVPVSNLYLNGGRLWVESQSSVVRSRDDEGRPSRSHRRVRRLELAPQSDGTLAGKAHTPRRNGRGVTTASFTAKRIPALPPAPDLSDVRFGPAIKLFNGEDLSGWVLTNTRATNGWGVENGTLVNNPIQTPGEPHRSYGNLRSERTFEDFTLTLEVNVPKGSNSGVYLRGIYEVQVSDSYGRPVDSHHMGALYSRITPTVAAEKPAGQWQSLDVTLCDRHVSVKLNGTTIVGNQPLLGVTGGALSADQFSPGPIYLQGDHGKVSYRNMVLRPILK